MNDVNQLVSIYHTLYIVLGILAAVFFVLSIFLFFKFNIRRIWAIKSGRAVKRSIKEMQEATALSGKMRSDKPFLPREKSKKLKEPKAAQVPTVPSVPKPEVEDVTGPIGEPPQPPVVSTPSQEIRDGADATGMLSNETPVTIGTFIIEKSDMYVHTEEVI